MAVLFCDGAEGVQLHVLNRVAAAPLKSAYVCRHCDAMIPDVEPVADEAPIAELIRSLEILLDPAHHAVGCRAVSGKPRRSVLLVDGVGE